MKNVLAAIAVAAPVIVTSAPVAEASIIVFTSSGTSMSLDQSRSLGDRGFDPIGDIVKASILRQSGGSGSGISSYFISMGDAFVFGGSTGITLTPPSRRPDIPAVVVPDPELPIELPPRDIPPVPEIPPVTEQDPESPPEVTRDPIDLPEPRALGLIGFGLISLSLFSRRRST